MIFSYRYLEYINCVDVMKRRKRIEIELTPSAFTQSIQKAASASTVAALTQSMHSKRGEY